MTTDELIEYHQKRIKDWEERLYPETLPLRQQRDINLSYHQRELDKLLKEKSNDSYRPNSIHS